MSDSGIFKAAVKLAPDQRPAFLDRACGQNQEMRREVESLLRANDAAGSFLRDPPDRQPGTVDHEPIAEAPGTVIGPYKLREQIGEGGFGVVYVAEQEKPVRRKVALKIIKPGMDSAQVIARFEAERQALAMMDHTNIARVYDAGTTESGRPYFVMELVHGVPITDYCDANQLTPRQRLELFVPVCQAIQHAHQKGVIHRDIKPSNILVTMYDDKPVPKVIDFGVAKAIEQRLTEKTVYTQFGTLVGTFEYMSPEQAELNAFGVDTRSDIYSLGVLLYELLTGTTPLERKRLREVTFGEVVRLIKEEEPPRPSVRLSTSGALAKVAAARKTDPAKLSRLVKGELDWVVMKCLEKDRTRRYETANGLARDVERYLRDEPVEARPASAGYRLRKLARRNKVALTTAAVVAGALVLGTILATWQAVRATRAEHLAGDRLALAQDERDRAVALEQLASDRLKEIEKQRDRAEQESRAARAARDAEQRTGQSLAMKTVEAEVKSGNFVGARRRLMQFVPDLGEPDPRGFEWHYWYRHTHGGRLVASIPKDRWDLGTLSPNGRRVAVRRESKVKRTGIEVFDVGTAESQCVIPRQVPTTETLSLSADGGRVAVLGLRGTLKEAVTTLSVWHCGTGALLLEQELDVGSGRRGGRYRGIDLNADGTRVALARITRDSPDQPVRAELLVCDVDANRPLLKQEGAEEWNRVCLDASGKRLAAFVGHGRESGSGKRREVLAVYDVETAKKVATLFDDEDVDVAQFTPDGKQLVYISMEHGGTKNLWVWDPATGTRKQLGTGLPVWPSLVVSPDGALAAAGGRSSSLVRVWEIATGRLTHQLPGHAAGIDALAFDASQKNLLTLDLGGEVRNWSLAPPDDAFALRARPIPRVLQFRLSADQALLAVISDPQSRGILNQAPPYEVRVRRRDGAEVLCYHGHDGPDHLCFSPDGKRLAFLALSGSGATQSAVLHVCDPATGKELWTWKPPVPGIRSGMWIGYNPAPFRNLTPLRTRSIANKQPFPVHPIVFSADGSRLAFRPMLSAFVSQKVHVLSAADGSALLSFTEPHNLTHGSHYDFTFHDGVPFLAGVLSGDKGSRRLAILDAHSGKIVAQHQPKEDLPSAYQIQPAPDGRHAAVVLVYIRTDVWDVASGKKVLSLDGDWQPVFSPDGSRVALLGYNASGGAAAVAVQVYDLRDGRRICQFTAEHMVIDKLRFSADGTRLLTKHRFPWHLDQEEFAGVRIWDLSTGHEVMAVEATREFFSVWDADFDSTGRRLTLVEFLRDARQLPGRFEVLDGAPLSTAEDAELKGPLVAGRLFDRLLLREDVVSAIQGDAHLTPELRAAALSAAGRLRESAGATALNHASWTIVVEPARTPESYRQALRWAEAAARLNPNWAILNTLGVAQYRAEQFAEAIQTLERAVELAANNEPHPSDFVFLALAHHRLGHAEQAHRYLKQFDELMMLPRWSRDQECLGFQKEAEAVIARETSSSRP